MKKSFLYLLLIIFVFHPHSKSENNYKLITLFEINSNKKNDFVDVYDMKYEYVKSSDPSLKNVQLDERFIRVYDDSKLEIDKRSHFIKEKVDLNIKFKDDNFCQKNKKESIKIFALKDKNEFTKIFNENYVSGNSLKKIDLNLDKFFENHYQIKNNEYFFALKFVLNKYYRSLYHGFIVYDLKKCIETISPKYYEFYKESWHNNLNKDQIYNQVQTYYRNNQILKINEKKYNFDKLIIKGMYVNGAESNKNFFVTEISNDDVKRISEKGIQRLNFTWSPWIHYGGNMLVDKEFKKVKLKNFEFEREISIFFYIKFILLISIPISFFYIFKSKKFPIKIINYYFIFNVFTILILLVTLFAKLSEANFIYFTLLILTLFSYFLLIYERSEKAMAPERIIGKQIEAARVALTRHMKRQGRVWTRIFPNIPVSKKPAEVRMGKGKGAPD